MKAFGRRLRDECLNVEWFGSLQAAREKRSAWQRHYNRERPHSALADRTPDSFAARHLVK